MIDARLVAFGPYIFSSLRVILIGAALAACWLIYTGVRYRLWWRLVVGMPVALYLMLVFAAAVSIIR